MGAKRYQKWDKLTVKELRVYFGFRILMGMVKLPGLADYWRRDPPLHQASIADRISRNRFQISRFLHFADNSNLPERGQPGRDHLGKVQPVVEALHHQFLDSYSPHCEQAIDEAMISFQGRSSLKQYLPLKPVKQGIKVWCRADSHNGYICEFQIYMGKQDSGQRKRSLGERVVLDLTQKLQGQHYHLYLITFFTSTMLLSTLLSKGLYACGTAWQYYKGYPAALKMKGKGKREQRRMGLTNRYVHVHVAYICVCAALTKSTEFSSTRVTANPSKTTKLSVLCHQTASQLKPQMC